MQSLVFYVFPVLWYVSCVAFSGNNKSPRQRWEFGRFLKTAGYYNALLPKLPFFSQLSNDRLKLSPKSILWSPENRYPNCCSIRFFARRLTPDHCIYLLHYRNELQWGPLDDVVMGGVSKTALEPGQAFDGVWKGFVTSANNGGFAGIRTKLLRTPWDLSSCKGIRLRVVGDGNRYKFITRDDEEWNGIAWSYSFDTSRNTETTIQIPFTSLRPTRFARTMPGTLSFNQARVTALQLSLSKFEYDGALNPKFTEGEFLLSIKAIETY